MFRAEKTRADSLYEQNQKLQERFQKMQRDLKSTKEEVCSSTCLFALSLLSPAVSPSKP